MPDTPIVMEHAVMIDADSAGNPRVQFVIHMDEQEEKTDVETETQTTEAAG